MRLFAAVVVTICSLACDDSDVSAEGEGEGEPAEGEGEGEGEIASPRFIAVGYGGRRLTSADGSAWGNDVAVVEGGGDDDNLLRGVCAHDGVVLAVGGSGHGVVRRSIDGGESWTTTVNDARGWIGACAFNHDGVAVFVGSARSSRSVDGGVTLIDHENRFYAGGNWQMRDVIVVDDTFVAVGDLGVSNSVDGINWTDPAGPRNLSRAAHGNGHTVVVGGALHAHSTDLTTWTETAHGGVGDIVFADGGFLIVGEGFDLSSVDGVEFVQHAQPAMSRVAVGVVDGASVYVGINYPDVRRTSSDGRTWSEPIRDDKNAIDDLLFVP